METIIINNIILLLCLFIAIEIFLLFKTQKIVKKYRKILFTIKKTLKSERLNDLQKQKLLTFLSINYFKINIYIFFILLLVCIPFILSNFLLAGFFNTMISFTGLVSQVFFLVVYLHIRVNKNENSK